MSVLANQTNSTETNSFFIRNSDDVSFLSSISVFGGSIHTSEIQLDQIQMDCAVINGYPTLLLNGDPVAGVSSLTSSVTSWASYPALQTITSAGPFGGAANLVNVNASSNVSSATITSGTLTNSGQVNTNTLSTASMTVSTINGQPFPLSTTPVIAFAGATIINGASYNIDFTGQPQGFYLVTVSIQTGTGLDPMSCSAVITYINGNTTGGCFHCPNTNAGPPSFANCVSIQDAILGSLVTVFVYSNSVTIGLQITPQFAVYRLT